MTDASIPEASTTAAELALGLLQGEDRAAALRRTLSDPSFAAEVNAWRDHFGLLFEAVPDVAPPAGLIARIEAVLDNQTAADRPAANDDRPVRLWRRIAIASSLASVLLLAITLLRPAGSLAGNDAPQIAQDSPPALPSSLLVGQIQPLEAGPPVAAVFDPATGRLRVAAAALVDASHSPELWVIPVGGTPHSLGVLHSRQPTVVTIGKADRARLAAGATLAVTVEPVGGSPSGKPTGAVVAQGPLTLV